MPVRAVAKHIGVTDKRLWRVVHHYVAQALSQFDLSQLKAIGLDESASKRGHNYVTVFIDMERNAMLVVFATSGRGKQTLQAFRAFLQNHKGNPAQGLEVVCDMSPAFLQGISETLPEAEVTVDWFHIVQTFTRALDEVRKQEHRQQKLPKHTRWAVLKRWGVHHLTRNQQAALIELLGSGAHTATAWMIKEKLSWIRQAKTPQAARWRITNFLRYARKSASIAAILEPMNKALDTLQRHAERVVRRWGHQPTPTLA